jgi:thiosulfate dehydrogenase
MKLRYFALGIVAGVAAVLICFFGYFQFGFAPVGTKDPQMPFERYLARTARHAWVAKAAQTQSPVQPTEAALLAGARVYRAECAVCHGLPSRKATNIQKGLFPDAPALVKGKGVTDDPVGSTHWVVAKGIRMSGMPSYERWLSDEQLWQVSLLLLKANELPASVQDLLKQPDTVMAASDPR